MQPVRGMLPSAEGNPARHCRASAATREQAGWGSQGGSVSPPRLPVLRPLSSAPLGPSAFAEVVKSSDAINRKSKEDWGLFCIYFNPFQCSCLENPRDSGAWWAAISGVAQSRTRLKRLSSSSNSSKTPMNPPIPNLWLRLDGHLWSTL